MAILIEVMPLSLHGFIRRTEQRDVDDRKAQQVGDAGALLSRNPGVIKEQQVARLFIHHPAGQKTFNVQHIACNHFAVEGVAAGHFRVNNDRHFAAGDMTFGGGLVEQRRFQIGVNDFTPNDVRVLPVLIQDVTQIVKNANA
ncbi:hypothetical protein D3C81_787150 [compost metagenome]